MIKIKLYVWYSKATSVTGRAIAKELGLTRGTNKFNRGYGTKIPPSGTTHVICWGARQPINRVEFRRRNLARRNVLNNPYLNELYKNKYVALKQMFISGVSVPNFTNEKFNASMIDGSIIGRTYQHFGGSGFKFIQNSENVFNDNQSDYWLEYVDGEDKREYRVHVFNGEVVRVQRKIAHRDEDGNKIEPTSYVCRSHSNGWRFSLRDKEQMHSSVLEQAIKAVQALNMSFGAVDIIRVPSQDRTVVLEVNSGMGLDNSGVELYTELFKQWVIENETRYMDF